MLDIGEAIDDFINDETSSATTAKTYFNRLTAFEDFLDGKTATREKVEKFLSQFRGQARTYNLTLIVLNRFYKYLIKKEYIEDNPCQNITRMKEIKTIPEPFTKPEIEQIFEINSINENIKRATQLMLFAGLRITEALQVKKRDIYTDNGTMFIKVMGKGKKQREVYVITDDITRELTEYINTLKDNDNLVNTTFQYLQKWGRNKLKTKIDNFHWHRLRKTCATWLVEQGVPFEQTQIFLGHESAVTTEIYTKHILNKTDLVKIT